MQDAGKSKGRQRYSDDLRHRVLTKLASGGASLRQVSKEFGVSVPTLIKWRKDERSLGSTPALSAPTTDQNSSVVENQRLREEIKRLTEERNRLRRSIAMLVGVKISD
jgi:transposase-like protein